MSQRLATICHRRPHRVLDRVGEGAGGRLPLLKAVYKELEFHSLLKELGPGEDTRPRDYRVLATPEELQAWLDAIRRARRAPIAISKSAEGEFALDTIGLAWQPGEARAVHSENLPHLKPWLEDASAVKITCDVKSALLTLDRMGVRCARLRSRRDAVRLPAGRRSRPAARSTSRRAGGST